MTLTRAMAVDGRGGTEPIELPLEPPGPGEVVLRVLACGLCGTDLFKLESDTVPPGTVLGHELVGSVLDSGAGVSLPTGTRLAVPHHAPCNECDLCRRGNETMCAIFQENLLRPGGFSERVTVARRGVERVARRLPESLSDQAALFLEPAACVVRAIRRSGLAPAPEGAPVAVLGAGSMGLLHLLVLRALHPATPVVLVEPIAQRRALALELGASAAIEPGEAWPLAPEFGEAVAVFDTVGGEAALATALDVAAPGATLVLFAHAPQGEKSRIDLHEIFRQERRLVSSYSGGPGDQETAWALLTTGSLDPRPLVSHTLPLSQLDRAIDLARSREALKVVITPSRAPS